MSGNSKRIPKKKPDHESGFYEEYPAEDERTSGSNSFNLNSRTSEDYPNKMKRTIKNIKNRKKSDIVPPNGFSIPEKKREEKLPVNKPPVAPPSKSKPNVIDESDNFVLILSDGEEEEAASIKTGSHTKENLKMDRPVSEKTKREKPSCTYTGSFSQNDKEWEQISKIRKYGGRFFFSFYNLPLSPSTPSQIFL